MTPSRALAPEAIELIARETPGTRAFRAAVLNRLCGALDAEWYAWVLTDPGTAVGVDPVARIPDMRDLARTIRLKYLTALNRWTSLDVVATLGERAGESALWREAQRDHGVADVASVVLRDRFGCWGFLDLWSAVRFTADDVSLLRALAPGLTRAVRRSRADSFATEGAPRGARSSPQGSTAILLLDDDLTIVSQTADSASWLRRLLPQPGPRDPIPACAYNVAAQLIARENGVDSHEARARMPLAAGEWVTLQAARLEPGRHIAVTIEPSSTADRLDLLARATGLSGRERAVLTVLAEGADTRDAAARLFVSPHTVQDHLKSIFAKTGTHSRRELLTRIVGVAAS